MRKLDRLAEQVLGYLEADEHILTGVLGSHVTELGGGRRSIRTAACFATTTRVVVFAPRLFRFDLDVVPYPRITSVEGTRDTTGAHVTVRATSGSVQMKWIKDGDYRAFVEVVGRHVNGGAGPPEPVSPETSAPEPSAPAPAAGVPDIPTQIRQLAELRDAGILSEEEFAAKKSELLARM